MSLQIPEYLHGRVAEILSATMTSIEEIREAALQRIRAIPDPDAKGLTAISQELHHQTRTIRETIDGCLVKLVHSVSFPGAVERRRYALLQAAAVLRSQIDVMYVEANRSDSLLCVNEAEALLAEIEKRENTETQS